MIVKFLQDTDYEPASDDPRRCFGQLRKRATTIEKEVEVEKDGEKVKTIRKVGGPMVHFFKAGATPELKDDVAQAFIEAGAAEPFELIVNTVSKEEILKDVKPLA